jgi:phospholipase C
MVFDHTSVLKLIEWRWNLRPLTARDASAEIGNLASALDFASPRAELSATRDPIHKAIDIASERGK